MTISVIPFARFSRGCISLNGTADKQDNGPLVRVRMLERRNPYGGLLRRNGDTWPVFSRYDLVAKHALYRARAYKRWFRIKLVYNMKWWTTTHWIGAEWIEGPHHEIPIALPGLALARPR